MVETFKQIFVLVTGCLLLFNGYRIIKHGRFEIGIGGGRVPSRPLFDIRFKGMGARVFSITSLIGGLATFVLLVVVWADPNVVSLDTAFSMGILVVVGLLVIGLIVGLFVQGLGEMLTVVGKNIDKNLD